MDTPTSTTSPAATPTVVRTRWPHAGPAQKRLLLASLIIVVASFLPWVDTAVGRFSGMAGPGVWTMYAGVAGLAGSLVRSRRLALGHAVVTGVAAVLLPVWQLARLARLCTLDACMPSTGLWLVLAAGALALTAAWRLHTQEQ